MLREHRNSSFSAALLKMYQVFHFRLCFRALTEARFFSQTFCIPSPNQVKARSDALAYLCY